MIDESGLITTRITEKINKLYENSNKDIITNKINFIDEDQFI